MIDDSSLSLTASPRSSFLCLISNDESTSLTVSTKDRHSCVVPADSSASPTQALETVITPASFPKTPWNPQRWSLCMPYPDDFISGPQFSRKDTHYACLIPDDLSTIVTVSRKCSHYACLISIHLLKLKHCRYSCLIPVHSSPSLTTSLNHEQELCFIPDD